MSLIKFLAQGFLVKAMSCVDYFSILQFAILRLALGIYKKLLHFVELESELRKFNSIL